MTTTYISPNRWILAGLLGLGLCQGATRAVAEYTEELHETYPLAAEGRLSLDEVNGTVRITAWDRNEVKLDAVKHGKDKEHFEAVKIEINAKPDHLKIHTKYPDSKSWSWRRHSGSTSVDYTLSVPRGTRLDEISAVNGTVEIDGVRGTVHASTVNGALKARGLAADTSLSSVNGRVKAAFDRFETVKSVSLSAVNGSLELNLPEDTNADLKASTVNGGISGDVPVKKNWPIGREINTQLGKGGARIKLSTVNGGMTIHLAR